MPYKYSKRGTIQAPRFVEDAITVPEFKSVQEALDFLASISQRAGAGELELQSANDVSNLVRNWIMGVTAQDELQLKIAKENPQGPQEIHCRGITTNAGDRVLSLVTLSLTAITHQRPQGHRPRPPTDSVNGQVVSSALAQSDEPPANQLETNANTSSDT